MEQFRRQSTRQVLKFSSAEEIGRGGEAVIYSVPGHPALVAKVYHAERRTSLSAGKLSLMIQNPPADPMAGQGHDSIAWPSDLLLMENSSSAGFLMPRVSGMHPIIDFYHPATRKKQCPLFTWQYLLRTARNLTAAMRALHLRGYVVGDVNESNILVSDTALVTLVDTDSFQVSDLRSGQVFRCPVGKSDFTPPELQGITFRDVDRAPEHDCFGLAVVLFKLLMEGTHPFDGVYRGQGDPPLLEKRIQAGYFPHGLKSVPYEPKPGAPPFDILPSVLQTQFRLCFEEGHAVPALRPDAQTWLHALDEAEKALVVCKTNKQHQYAKHLAKCPWCERTALFKGVDPFPSKKAVQAGVHLDRATPVQKPLPSAKTPKPAAKKPTPAPVSAPSPTPILSPTRPLPPPAIVHPILAKPKAAKKADRYWSRMRSCCAIVGVLTALFVGQMLLPTYRPVLAPPSNAAALLQSRRNSADGAEMVWVPGGPFVMGDGREDNPRHTVALPGYWIYKYPVTAAQYERFCRETHRKMPAAPASNPTWTKKDLPVVGVNFNDAYDYCQWAHVSLPTEAQWEKAARGPKNFAYPWGNVFEPTRLWCGVAGVPAVGPASVFRTQRVAASGYGCVDMAGNVMQWCQDIYDAKSWKTGARLDSPSIFNMGEVRALRGGSWNSMSANNFLAARRYRNLPDSVSQAYGIRCVVDGLP